MATCTVHFKSTSLAKQDTMTVILPDAPRRPLPVLYLLHGLSDDHSTWQRRTAIERHAENLRLIIVMPDTHRFFYVNDPRPGGLAYEDHIVKDVVGFVDHTFRTIRSRRARAVAGLSMGGYGALMLALRHPALFSAAVSHSGALMFAHRAVDRRDIAPLAAALPKRGYDLWPLARRLAKGRRRVAIRMDCGTEDGLLEVNREFHGHLSKLGIEHEYAEHPGGHDWAYWDTHVRDTLRFVVRHLARR
jgi:S-formylglutathione hydrolase FrmB